MGSNPVWRITLPSATDCTSRGVRIPQPTVTSVVHSLCIPHGHGAGPPSQHFGTEGAPLVLGVEVGARHFVFPTGRCGRSATVLAKVLARNHMSNGYLQPHGTL